MQNSLAVRICAISPQLVAPPREPAAEASNADVGASHMKFQPRASTTTRPKNACWTTARRDRPPSRRIQRVIAPQAQRPPRPRRRSKAPGRWRRAGLSAPLPALSQVLGAFIRNRDLERPDRRTSGHLERRDGDAAADRRHGHLNEHGMIAHDVTPQMSARRSSASPRAASRSFRSAAVIERPESSAVARSAAAAASRIPASRALSASQRPIAPRRPI